MSVRVKPIPITLDKERSLLFDWNALAEAEEKLNGESIFDVLQKKRVKDLRTLMWAALLHEDESLTEKEVGALLGLQDMDQIATIITQAVSKSLPEAKNTKPRPARTAKN